MQACWLFYHPAEKSHDVDRRVRHQVAEMRLGLPTAYTAAYSGVHSCWRRSRMTACCASGWIVIARRADFDRVDRKRIAQSLRCAGVNLILITDVLLRTRADVQFWLVFPARQIASCCSKSIRKRKRQTPAPSRLPKLAATSGTNLVDTVRWPERRREFLSQKPEQLRGPLFRSDAKFGQ